MALGTIVPGGSRSESDGAYPRPMRGTTLGLLLILGACGSCGGAQLPSSDRTPVPARIHITNDTDATIYLHSKYFCGFGALAIGDLDLYWGQSLSCERVQTDQPCPVFGGCAGPGIRPLEPGESWTEEWDGGHLAHALVEPVGEECPSDCVVPIAAEPGVYPVHVDAYSECRGEGCDCEPASDDEGCYPGQPFEGEPDLHAEAQLTVPETSSSPIELELRFR